MEENYMKNAAISLTVVCLIFIAGSLLTSCDKRSKSESNQQTLNEYAARSSSQQPALYEDIEGGSASAQPSNQVSEAPAALDGNGEIIKPDGSYKWTQTFVESNYSGKTAFTGETAVIVINSDGNGMINEFIPCRLNGDELIIEYSMGDAGNSTTSGTLKITTFEGKKHIEGNVNTSNPDGFTVKEIWIMDEQ
jgi:hypothetical protein